VSAHGPHPVELDPVTHALVFTLIPVAAGALAGLIAALYRPGA
jgi:hypothetical protein